MPIKQYKTVLIAGGSGLVGQRLTELLESKSYRVFILSHNKAQKGDNVFHWDPEKKLIDEKAISETDVIINLAGAPIAANRWTPSVKRKIVNSRIFSTNLLSEILASKPNKVSLVINASAIGIYGDNGEMFVHEDHPAATDFLGQTCLRWENAAKSFSENGIRTVVLRIGIVLSDHGGMLTEIRKPLKFRIAPIFGNGRQYQSWIHIDDLCRMMTSAITNENISGTYNAVAPGPLSNRNFIKLLTQIIGGDFWIIRIPKFFLKIFLGEMSKVVMEGSRVSSKKIESTGFIFKYSQANHALRNLLGK